MTELCPFGGTRTSPPRDMDRSMFAAPLEELVTRIKGASAAALVDPQGETVDYAGATDPFEIRVAAAHFEIVLSDARRTALLADAQVIILRASRRSFILHRLYDGYAIVVLVADWAAFSPSARALSHCERALGREAGWNDPVRAQSWHAAEVKCDSRGRPAEISTGHGFRHVEVIGALASLGRGERGYRIRADDGTELTVVREPGGFWYADDPTDPEQIPPKGEQSCATG